GGVWLAWAQPRVVEREPARDQAELAESVPLARGLRRHPGQRIEIVHLCSDLRAEQRGIEPIDAPHWGCAPANAGPEGVATHPDRGDHADARDPDPSALHVGSFVVRRVTDRPDRMARAAASAIVRNVARVRPATGRTNPRSTKTAQPGAAGSNTCSIVTRQPPSAGSMRHATSMPFVAPPR